MGSKPEHVIKAEGTVAAEQPVIAEEAAGGVTDNHVSTGAGPGPCRRVESVAVIPQTRAGTGNLQARAGDLGSAAIVQNDLSRAHRPPPARCRIDQLTKRVIAGLAQP